jgi:hypothetical protein
MPFDGGVFTDQAAWRAALPSKIRIVNPTPGGDRFTSLHKAQDYVRRGCARLSACGTRLRFVETHHVTRSAELTAKELADQAWRLSARLRREGPAEARRDSEIAVHPASCAGDEAPKRVGTSNLYGRPFRDRDQPTRKNAQVLKIFELWPFW